MRRRRRELRRKRLPAFGRLFHFFDYETHLTGLSMGCTLRNRLQNTSVSRMRWAHAFLNGTSRSAAELPYISQNVTDRAYCLSDSFD